jgi:hypothetical protein
VADLAVGCLPVTLSLLYRAAGQLLTGIVANDPQEAVYLVSFTGDHGAKARAIVAMSSSSQATTCPGGRVVVADDVRGRPQPDGQPGQPVLDRRPHPGVVKDTNGGRTLYIQAAALRTDKESNCCRALPRAPGS